MDNGGMSALDDTSPEAKRILINIYRNMPIAEKWRRLGEIYRTAKILHATGVRARNPGASQAEIHEAWLAATLGESTLRVIKENRSGAGG
jgi:hypothetical protein